MAILHMMSSRTSWLLGMITCLSGMMTGCMVGPDFHSPHSPRTSRYNANPLPKSTASTSAAGKASVAQIYSYGKDLPADWWYVFRSPTINQLVKQGINNSPTMVSAQAALRQAQETLYAQIGNLLVPAFNAGLSGERQLFPGASLPGSSSSSALFNTFNASVNVAYTLDIFGGSRRQIEALRAQVDYEQFQLIATYLTLTTNIVTTAITIASLEEQIRATEFLIKAEQGQLNILRQQFNLGGIANTNVLSQQTLVDQAIAALPPLRKSLSQNKHALAVLTGVTPDIKMPDINLNKLNLPIKVPVSIPSKLVEQRPDVRAAEALLHAASAQIGVATANLFPQFTISGAYGWSSNTLPNLFKSTTKTWDILTQITQPIFQGGALLAERRAAIAAFDQSAAQYKQTVLQALQNVADVLRAIDLDAKTFQAQKAAERAAYKNMLITSEQYRDGGVSYANLLLAQQYYQQARISSIQAQAARYTDTAALYQSLGGGWWHRKASACDAVNRTNVSLHCP